MKKLAKKTVRKLRKYIRLARWYTKRIRTGEHKGSNRLSLALRLKVERISLRQLIGVNLAGVAFFAAVVIPQTSDLYSSLEVVVQDPENVIVTTPSASKYQWPIREFGISQRFSLVHPAMDLTNEHGTPVYSVSAGRVAWTKELPYGYGRHILVENGDGVQSLYAHMSKTDVREGQIVNKDTKLGEMGATGWATGTHLHLEIYDGGTPINPLEVLPELK